MRRLRPRRIGLSAVAKGKGKRKRTSDVDRAVVVVAPGRRPDLAAIDPAATAGLDKETAKARLADDAARIGALQARLYAEQRRALVVVLQGVDGSGKDGTIRHVFTGVNPVGLAVTAFGRPSDEELAHDFLWRVHRAVPRMGQLGVWNRSHYEDLLVPRIDGRLSPAAARRRCEQINGFEALLADLGVRLLKVFLHISRAEQKERLEARLHDPAKQFKFDPRDLEARARWDDYRAAYQDLLARCSTRVAPWHVVPADRKWFRNAAVARLIVAALEDMRPVPRRLAVDPTTVVIEP